ncbi:MAG: ATP-binding protein [Deltaproteobacteria bacterium]|nr:ATP-binding protein [Deltaproteobacteria bacterium]
MQIFNNQELQNNINELTNNPTLNSARLYWGKEDLIIRSAIDLRIFNTPFGSISLLYGPRQIGKTASLRLFLSRLTDSETIIFTDCSAILNKTDLAQHLSELIKGRTTIVLDEVQGVDGWHLALRSLHAAGKLQNCRVWCTGSEARHLLESGERLPGRKGLGVTVMARPWSFREYMDFLHPEQSAPVSKLKYSHVTQTWLDAQTTFWQDYWQSYLLTGGIPLSVGEQHKTGKIADATWNIYVDWIMGTWSRQRTAEHSLIALARQLCETLNSRVSFETLKKGTDILSPNTVKTLIEMQEDHFALKLLPRYDPQRERFLPIKLKKIYPIDPFIARVWASIGWNIRRLISKNVPFLHLDECAFLVQAYRWQNTPNVSYLYSDTQRAEVDFYFDETAFELKSGGVPTKGQRALLKHCPKSFFLNKQTLPIMAYLVGEGRGDWGG